MHLVLFVFMCLGSITCDWMTYYGVEFLGKTESLSLSVSLSLGPPECFRI